MRDRVGNFLKNTNSINPHVDQGFHSLRQIGNANETGSISKDPYLGNVEFILKFEQPNGSRDYVNSIPNDKWFYQGLSYADKSGSMSPGYISYSRSKFGNGSYFNNTCHRNNSYAIHGFIYTDIVSLGYEDFTLECWVNFTTLSQNNSSIFWLNGRGDTGYGGVASGYNLSGGFNLYLNSSGVLLLSAAGQTLSSGTTPFVVNTWHHVALIRKNGIIRVFVDGILKMSSIADANILATTGAETGYCFAPGNLKIFGIRASNSFYGDEVRFTRNVARYWDNFTPPSEEFSAPTKIINPNVIALMKFDESDVVKNHAGRSKDLVRIPPVVTNDKKFGVSSLQPNSYCSFHQLDPSGKIGTGDFNISCWIKPTAKNGSNGYPIFSLNKKLSLFVGGAQWATYNKSGLTGQDSPFDGRLTLSFDGRIKESYNGRMDTGIICQTAKNTVSLNVWQHILVSRKNHVYRIFVDGVLKATGYFWKLTPTATPSTTPTGFAYGNNIYVATTSSNNYSTSTDGLSWAARTLPLNKNWQSLIYANGTFSTIYNDANTRVTTSQVAHSTDGINWTTANLPSYTFSNKSGTFRANNWIKIAYGNNTYVAIATGDQLGIATSPDGTTWTKRSSPGGTDFRDLVFINGEFLILGNTRIWRSSNGTSWTSTNNSTTAFNSIVYGNNKYVTFNGSNIFTSSDLNTFTTVTIPKIFSNTSSLFNFLYYKLFFLDNKFYLFNTILPLRDKTRVLVSEDGVNWDYFTIPAYNAFMINNNGLIGHVRSGSNDTANIITPGEAVDLDTTYLIIGGYGGSTSGDIERGDYNTRINETTLTYRGGGYPNEFTMPTDHLNGNLNNRWGEFRFEGLIDEFIIDKNTGIDSNFTPPTSSISVRYSY